MAPPAPDGRAQHMDEGDKLANGFFFHQAVDEGVPNDDSHRERDGPG